MYARLHAGEQEDPDKPVVVEAAPDEVHFTVVQAELVSVSFTSDHHVMTDGDFFDGGGQVYSKPDWAPAQEHPNPISQTKGTRLSADVAVRILPAGIPFTLEGKGLPLGLQFSQQGVSTDETVSVSVTALGELPNEVRGCWIAIPWVADIDGLGEIDLGTSENIGFLTLGPPIAGEEPTVARIQFLASQLCQRCADDWTCMDRIFAAANQHFSGEPEPPIDPIWRLLDPNVWWAECQDTASFCAAAAKVIGAPGAIAVRYAYVEEDKQCSEAAGEHQNARRLFLDAPHPHAPTTYHDDYCSPYDQWGAMEWLLFIDGQDHMNQYEGCFKYSDEGVTKYYAPGGPNTGFQSLQSLMEAIVAKTIWVFWMNEEQVRICRPEAPSNGPGPCPEAVW